MANQHKANRTALLRAVIAGWCRDTDLAEAVAAHLGGMAARGAARKFGVAPMSVLRTAAKLKVVGKPLVEWAAGGAEGA